MHLPLPLKTNLEGTGMLSREQLVLSLLSTQTMDSIGNCQSKPIFMNYL